MRRDRGQYFILVTVFLDVFGGSIVIPVLPSLVGMLSSSVESKVQWIGVLAASYALMQFLFSPFLGILSDKYGRRPILLISTLILAITELLHAVASSVLLLLLCRILSGMTGATMSVANAYTADSTIPSQRSVAFGRMGAAAGVGFILGPMLGGILGGIDIRFPFYIAAILSFLNFIYGWFVLPRMKPVNPTATLSLTNVSPFHAIRDLVRISGDIAGLVYIIGLNVLAQVMLQSIWVVYTQFKFGWQPEANGMMLLFMGVLGFLISGFLMSKLQNYFGMKTLAMLGLISSAIAFLMYGLSDNGIELYFIATFTCLSAVSMPVLMGALSSKVHPDRQGTVMGTVASINSLAMIIAPLIATTTFSFVTDFSPSDWRVGMTFYMCFAIQIIVIIWAIRYFFGNKESMNI